MRTIKIMYNEDQKVEYINYDGTNTQTLTTYFKRLSDKEREYNKDILNMSLDELKETIISLGIRREESRRHLLSLLRGYANWGILNNIIKHSDIFQITAESVSAQEAIRSKMLKSPEQLKSILEDTLDFVNYENRSKRTSLIFWLLYSGIEMDEIYTLKKNSLDAKKKVVLLNSGKEYELNDEIILLWQHCAEATYLEKRNGKSVRADEYIQRELEENDLLFRKEERSRRKKDENKKENYLENTVSQVIQSYSEGKGTTYQIPPRNIRLSGIFYKLLCLERANEKITAEVIASQLEIPHKTSQELSLKVRKWRIDYEDWKLAFGYMNESINVK